MCYADGVLDKRAEELINEDAMTERYRYGCLDVQMSGGPEREPCLSYCRVVWSRFFGVLGESRNARLCSTKTKRRIVSLDTNYDQQSGNVTYSESFGQ